LRNAGFREEAEARGRRLELAAKVDRFLLEHDSSEERNDPDSPWARVSVARGESLEAAAELAEKLARKTKRKKERAAA
jgi:hypothetical protein